MGFKLSKIAKGVASVVSPVYALGKMTKASAPNLPGVPSPEYYPEIPGLSPEEIDYINKRRSLLSQYETSLGAPPTQYDLTTDQIAQLEQQRYLEALRQQTGQLSVSQTQARQSEFNRLKEAAGRRGIRILGDDPSTATSNSTAGNQLLSEFNKRYSLLADEARRADIASGYSQNVGRLGLSSQMQQARLGNILGLSGAYGELGDIYGAQRQAQYNRLLGNVDLTNQYRLTDYERQAQQAIANANAREQTRANRLGLINSAVGAGAMLYSGGVLGRPGAPAGPTGGIPSGYPPSYGALPPRLSLYGR